MSDSDTDYCEDRAARGAEALAFFADRTPTTDLLTLAQAEGARWGQLVAAENARQTGYGPDWQQDPAQVDDVLTDLVCDLLHLLDGYVAPEVLLATVHEIRTKGSRARAMVDHVARQQGGNVVLLIACLVDSAAQHGIEPIGLVDHARVDYEDDVEERRIAQLLRQPISA